MKAFDHSSRTTKAWSPYFETFCVCEDCKRLPEWLEVPAHVVQLEEASGSEPEG